MYLNNEYWAHHKLVAAVGYSYRTYEKLLLKLYMIKCDAPASI